MKFKYIEIYKQADAYILSCKMTGRYFATIFEDHIVYSGTAFLRDEVKNEIKQFHEDIKNNHEF